MKFLIKLFQWLINWPRRLFRFGKPSQTYARIKQKHHSSRCFRNSKKHEWVRKDIIKLKALMPKAGCRNIALQFNALQRGRTEETVSKSYVYNIFRQYPHEILEKRKRIKAAPPKKVPTHRIWALDLTRFFSDGKPILAVVDEGSRANLALAELPSKASIYILFYLIKTILCFGYNPSILKTDNERIFTSWLFKAALAWLGIKHGTTEVASPWQNGRVERFFGTLKQYKDHFKALCPDHIQYNLNLFRTWYNHYRPHQNLGGLTPSEAWNGKRRQFTQDELTLWQDHIDQHTDPPDG